MMTAAAGHDGAVVPADPSGQQGRLRHRTVDFGWCAASVARAIQRHQLPMPATATPLSRRRLTGVEQMQSGPAGARSPLQASAARRQDAGAG